MTNVAEGGKSRALLLTVGTGTASRLEESLIAPFRRSIGRNGPWSRVVLLPSRATIGQADTIREALPDAPIEIVPLPADGQEDNTDECFEHFDDVITGLVGDGIHQANIIVDITRGTKVMSAALALAAVRHDLPVLRYITGKRDDRGQVEAGAEEIFETRTTIVTARRRLDQALRYFKSGNFAAAMELIPDLDAPFADLWPQSLHPAGRAVRVMAAFYAAWDRLDYAGASAAAAKGGWEEVPREWRAVSPTPAMRDWVDRLARAPEQGDHGAMAEHLRLLAADLLANGERRTRENHFEDAVLRAYRVLELVGQFRLFERGLDSARVDPNHEAVAALRKRLAKKGNDFGSNKDGTLTAPRTLTARLLKQMDDPFGRKLLDYDEMDTPLRARVRNNSILVHGFEATGPGDREPLQALYADLAALLGDDGGEAAGLRLATARLLDLSKA